MARELFIYWRAGVGRAAAAQAATLAMQRALRGRHAGLTARLFVRALDAVEGEATLMETYASVPSGITAELQAEIDAAATSLQTYCSGIRHVEVFDEVED